VITVEEKFQQSNARACHGAVTPRVSRVCRRAFGKRLG
jgi:hypothetical protein